MSGYPRSSVWAAAVALVGTLLLGGCGRNQPAVCDSLDAVKQSADRITTANVSENGLQAFANDISQLQADVAELAVNAKEQFKPELQSLRGAMDRMSTSVTAAKADPNLSTLQQVRFTVSDVVEAVKSLGAAMSDTC
jgi:hypothetical protein